MECVLAQRLARRLCSKCKEPYTPTADALREARFPWSDGDPLPTLYQAKGCSQCSNTGYRGRLALHEVMAVSEGVERLAVERASSTSIAELAAGEGMESLRLDGLAKVLDGTTSLAEIFRVVA